MYSVDADHPARDVGEQLGRIGPAEGFLHDRRRRPDHGRRVLHFLNPLAAAVRSRTVANGDSPTPLTTQFRRAIYRRCSAVILRRRWMTRRFAGTGSFEKRDQDFPDNSPTYMFPWLSTVMPCGVV